MYSREVNDQVLTFGVSGKLIRNTLVMYDRETESYWGQIIGQAIDGPLAGTELEFVPAVHTTWHEWRELHPDSKVLNKNGRGRFSSYDSYFRTGQAGVIPEDHQDERLYTKEFTVGVTLGDEAVSYPFSALNAEPVVNDTIGGTDVVVTFNPGSSAGRVYERNVDGQVLTFTLQGEDIMVDAETQSTWDTTSGIAISGALEGKTLTQVKSTIVFWFGWKDWYPETRVYGLN